MKDAGRYLTALVVVLIIMFGLSRCAQADEITLTQFVGPGQLVTGTVTASGPTGVEILASVESGSPSVLSTLVAAEQGSPNDPIIACPPLPTPCADPQYEIDYALYNPTKVWVYTYVTVRYRFFEYNQVLDGFVEYPAQ